MKSVTVFSSFTNSMMMQYVPSLVGTIELDGRGGYRVRQSGRYTFDAATGAFAFASGPIANWPVVYEVSSGTPLLRLASTGTESVGPDLRIGEHVCRRRGDETFPDTAPGSDPRGGGTASASGPRNAGARGTLTFREEWGSNKIVDVDLATGRVESRYVGRNAYRGANGEVVFVNGSGALVIAGASGTAVTTIPVETEDLDLPVLSPDGRMVAYHLEPVYYDSRVVVVTREGRQLAEFEGMTEPDWTPDGRLVMAKQTDASGATPGIYMTDARLGRSTRLDPDLDDVSQPAVSPDGRRLAVVSHGHLWLLNLDGTGLRQLTHSDGGEERPAWSPDGTWLAAANDDYGVVLLVSVSTGDVVEMTNADEDTVQSSGRLTWRE